VGIATTAAADAASPAPRADELLRFRDPEGRCFLAETELRELRSLGVPFQVVSSACERELPVRFSLGDAGAFEDAPPESARLAVLCRLLAEGRAKRPIDVEFLGRNRPIPADGFVLDRAGGRRRYIWRVCESPRPSGSLSLAQRFPALQEYLNRSDARVVLSLGSGGLKLFSHVAVLRFLEKLDCADAVDEFWGCSAGALVALLYCHGLSPESIEQTGYDLYGGRYQIPLRPSRLQLLSGLACEVLGWTHALAGAGFVDCAQGIGRMIQDYCRDIRPVRPFYCLAYNLEEGRTEVLTPEHVPPQLGVLVTQTDAREAALASSAVPLFFVPRRIARASGAAHYIDGSTTEDVPLYSVVRKWDLDRAAGAETRKRLVILAVKLTPRVGSARVGQGRIGKLRLLQTVASAGQEAIHSRDLSLISGRPDVELLTLQLQSSNDDFFDTRRIPDYLRVAKEDFAEQLAALEQRLSERTPRPSLHKLPA
jgi:hypothetical protein